MDTIKSDIRYALSFGDAALHPVIAKRLRSTLLKIEAITQADERMNATGRSPNRADYERIVAALIGPKD
jgi:hypothetical protein